VDEIRVAAVIPARNEEKFIDKTLDALRRQYRVPNHVLVIDDGSADSTAEIARGLGAEVIQLEDRGYNVVGTPVLARVINKGLEAIETRGIGSSPNDYVLILGADHILPPEYITTLLNFMESDRKIAISSGQIRGEKSIVPRGSGRMVRADLWKDFGLRYPENYGFETFLIVKAQQQGYKVSVLNGLLTETQRKTGKLYSKNAFISYGKSLKALGYSRLYSAARIGAMSIHHPRGGIYMMRGYFSTDVESYDPLLRSYLSSIQHKRIKRFVRNPAKIFLGEAA
jgi:glycosyltransferase involved in cell wall biosynthesis